MRSFSTLTKLSLCASLAIFTAACDSDKSTSKSTDSKTPESVETQVVKAPIVEAVKLRPVVEAKGEALVQNAYLRERLTNATFAYARVPNIWSFIGTPKGNVYDAALNSQPFVDAATGIKEGFAENVIPELPPEIHSLARLITASLNSPIEIAAIKASNPDVPVPNFLLSAGVKFDSQDQIQALLTELADASHKIDIIKPMSTAGYAEIDADGSLIQVIWDQSLSRLFILGGVDTQTGSLESLLKTLASNDTHQMLAVEKTIDESGQGLFAWVNPKSFSDISKAMGREQEYAAMAMSGLGSMKNIAVGMGTSQGINRLKFAIDMPVFGFRAYLPAIKTAPTFNLAGKTNLVAVMGIPDKRSILALEQLMTMAIPPKGQQEYLSVKQTFAEKMGFEIEDIFAMFGQDISLVSGEVGMHLAIRLNDKAMFKKMLDTSVKEFNLPYEERVINGHTYHHLQIPPMDMSEFDELLSQGGNDDELKILKRFMNAPGRLFWEQEGDYLIMASIPQILIDRHYVETTMPVNEWLENEQRISSEGSLFMLSVRNEGLAETMYRFQVELLGYLGDFVDRPVDLFSLPSPKEANLPKSGSAGIKITSSDRQIALELVYENNPFELLFTQSGYMAVAAVGVMSAVAIPAYQDYTFRVKCSEGVLAAKTLTLGLENFKRDHSRFPSAAEIDDLSLNKQSANYALSVEPDTGKIIVSFHSFTPGGSAKSLIMTPSDDEGTTDWACHSDIEDKHLPQDCRSSYY